MAEISKIQPIGSSTQYDLSALKIKVNSTSAPSSATTYRLIHCNATDGYTEVGVTTTLGLWRDSTSNYLVIGNNTSLGGVTLQKGNGKYADLVPGTLTANRTITFPDASGTVLLANGTGNATQFLRGDNTWSNTLGGNFYANTIVATNTTTNGSQFGMRFSDKNNSMYGLIWTSRTANRGGFISFRQYAENSSGTLNGYMENYRFPDVTANLTSNPTYYILTSKNYTDYAPTKSHTHDYRANTAPTSGAWYRGTPLIGSDGVMEIGRYIDFHASNTTTADYDFRFTASSGSLSCSGKLYGAVWNDYAEYRETKESIEPGRCIVETGNGDLVLSTERLQEGCEIVSDTFGFAIGQNEKNNTPTATSGRVLTYLYENKEQARPGQPVCSGPNGTVSLMTNEEAREWPWCIIGTISEIPDYDIWQAGNNKDHPIKVNNRIWIRVR